MSSILPGDGPLTLPKSLTIKNILAVQEIILRALDNNTNTVLDVAEGAQVDLSFVQLVTAARSHARGKAGQVLLARPAAGDLYDVLKRGGFLDDMTPDAADFWLHQENV